MTVLANWPVPKSAAGKDPVITDGVHTRAEFLAWEVYRKAQREGIAMDPPYQPKAIRVHRGVDIMWRRAKNVAKDKAGFPFGSVGFYAPVGEYERPVVAAQAGKVFRAEIRHVEGGKVTGGAVILEHAAGYGTGYHHLARIYVHEGDDVKAGQLIGIMGGSPHPVTGHPIGLVHLHFDVALHGKFVDPAPFLRGLPALSLEQVWGAAVSVGPPEDDAVA